MPVVETPPSPEPERPVVQGIIRPAALFTQAAAPRIAPVGSVAGPAGARALAASTPIAPAAARSPAAPEPASKATGSARRAPAPAPEAGTVRVTMQQSERGLIVQAIASGGITDDLIAQLRQRAQNLALEHGQTLAELVINGQRIVAAQSRRPL